MTAFSDLICSLATGTYVVTRPTGPGTLVDGVYSPASTKTLTLVALITPASGRDLLTLPEGRRNEEIRKVRTTTPIYAAASGPDELTIDGEQWVVFEAHSSTAFADVFYTAMIAKKAVA